MLKYCFVGEKRSTLAIAKNWRWSDGHLAAKQLFDALTAIGINPTTQCYTNVFENDFYIPDGVIIVAMGEKVSKELTKRAIDHIKIIHPATRGKIRRKDLYIQHVREQLCNQ